MVDKASGWTTRAILLRTQGRTRFVPESPDAYAVLQVDPNAELIVIQAAYRALARRFHPDGDMPDIAKMAELNHAFGVLRDPTTRAEYDQQRQALRTRAVPITQPQTTPTEVGASRPAVTGRSVLDFGRYQGWTIADLARRDPDYLRWLSRHSSGIRFRSAIADALPKDPDLNRNRSSVG
jgi:curved DNA-binding protein CbpA